MNKAMTVFGLFLVGSTLSISNAAHADGDEILPTLKAACKSMYIEAAPGNGLPVGDDCNTLDRVSLVKQVYNKEVLGVVVYQTKNGIQFVISESKSEMKYVLPRDSGHSTIITKQF